MKDFKIDMVKNLPLRDLVFDSLRKAILLGELQPGERLMELQLAEKMRVSRTPIREAIRKLEIEGLIIMIPRRGAIVAGISDKDLKNVLEVRSALEVLSADLACKRINDDKIEALKKAELDFRLAIENSNEMEIADADEAFHDIIYQASGNEMLIRMLNNLRENIYRFRLEYIKDKGAREDIANDHRDILSALCERDAGKVCSLTRIHIKKQEDAISSHLQTIANSKAEDSIPT